MELGGRIRAPGLKPGSTAVSVVRVGQGAGIRADAETGKRPPAHPCVSHHTGPSLLTRSNRIPRKTAGQHTLHSFARC